MYIRAAAGFSRYAYVPVVRAGGEKTSGRRKRPTTIQVHRARKLTGYTEGVPGVSEVHDRRRLYHPYRLCCATTMEGGSYAAAALLLDHSDLLSEDLFILNSVLDLSRCAFGQPPGSCLAGLGAASPGSVNALPSLHASCSAPSRRMGFRYKQATFECAPSPFAPISCCQRSPTERAYLARRHDSSPRPQRVPRLCCSRRCRKHHYFLMHANTLTTAAGLVDLPQPAHRARRLCLALLFRLMPRPIRRPARIPPRVCDSIHCGRLHRVHLLHYTRLSHRRVPPLPMAPAGELPRTRAVEDQQRLPDVHLFHGTAAPYT